LHQVSISLSGLVISSEDIAPHRKIIDGIKGHCGKIEANQTSYRAT